MNKRKIRYGQCIVIFIMIISFFLSSVSFGNAVYAYEGQNNAEINIDENQQTENSEESNNEVNSSTGKDVVDSNNAAEGSTQEDLIKESNGNDKNESSKKIPVSTQNVKSTDTGDYVVKGGTVGVDYILEDIEYITKEFSGIYPSYVKNHSFTMKVLKIMTSTPLTISTTKQTDAGIYKSRYRCRYNIR